MIDNSSSISVVLLWQEAMLLWHYMTECGDEIGVDDYWGTILGRFTCKNVSSWEDPMCKSKSQIGSWRGRPTTVPGPHLGLPRYTISHHTAGVLYELLND